VTDKTKVNDSLRAWLGPLLKEATERGIETSSEILIAAKPPEGKLYGPFNWLLFGQLLIRKLGWEDTYPSEPNSERRPQKRAS